jgi:hypothetical protein
MLSIIEADIPAPIIVLVESDAVPIQLPVTTGPPVGEGAVDDIIEFPDIEDEPEHPAPARAVVIATAAAIRRTGRAPVLTSESLIQEMHGGRLR